ncbi:MAG: 30S ribosomal protein S20 [Planctomycetota bacterium]|jgi:small subunit ribosomal protein S20
MAHSLSAKKRIRQNKKRMLRNRVRKERLKSATKAFDAALESGDAGKTNEALRNITKAIDKAKTKGILHRKTADRKKSRLSAKAAKLASAKS